MQRTFRIAVAPAITPVRISFMNLHAIIEKVSDEADDFLAGASNRSEARAGIAELLNAQYRQLSPEERAQVVTGVMAILEEEDFFTGTPGNEATVGDDDEADDERVL
jgi:hypothetical protein